MPAFLPPKAVVTGIKEKVESLTIQADRLYLGTSTGNLYIYSLEPVGDDESGLRLVQVKKNLTRKAIDMLGYIKDINSLVVLSDSSVTLYPLPNLSPPTPLVKAKIAFSFAVYSSVQQCATNENEFDTAFGKAMPIPTRVTHLLVGCQRRAVLYTWKDGELQEVKEATLPHTARTISFFDNDIACFAYPKVHAIFTLSTMTAVEVTMPVVTTTSTTTIAALTGLTGYMSLGLGTKVKPGLISISDKEVLASKDNTGLFIGQDGKLARSSNIDWPSPPEELAYVKPYIFSVFSSGTVPMQPIEPPVAGVATAPLPCFIPTTSIQICSALSPQKADTFSFPFNDDRWIEATATDPTITSLSSSPQPNASARLLTPSSSAKPSVFFVTTPMDRVTASSEGSCLWQFTMKSWTEQIDELVADQRYSDALGLLDALDEAVLPGKTQRRTTIRALNAVSQFRASKYDSAIDTFIDLDFNPAKVIALYPESISGRLAVPPEKWITLYGGPARTPGDLSTAKLDEAQEMAGTDQVDHTRSALEKTDSISASVSLKNRLQRSGLGMFKPTAIKDEDVHSIPTKKKNLNHDELHQSVETLVRYLGDRRPKLKAALESVNITPQNQSHKSTLSGTPVEDLFSLPNAPLSALTPEQLLRFAQIVDTALYKSYLIIRPALLRSLYHIPNWCEVSEVEEDLRARQKFFELKDLYHGKKMHAEALQLLRSLSEQETDVENKLQPSILYLQKLGPENLSLIFESSRWIFDVDLHMAFDIFTSEDVEHPRQAVADFLEKIDPMICIRYLEYIINDKQEVSPIFHNRLADLYLEMSLTARRRNNESFRGLYNSLLSFLGNNDLFGIDRLYGQLSATDLFEARAVLLGRLGRHDQALELYVHHLHDYAKAEEYCKRIYESGTETQSIFLTLLRIYLRPSIKTRQDLLTPALELISRHNPRLDPIETLQLLPPLVTTADLRAFLIESLRPPVFETRVVRQISKARNDHIGGKLMMLHSRRVKVTESRICPQCHKRIGHSVIAVHNHRGEVTHYQCRELFANKLKEESSH